MFIILVYVNMFILIYHIICNYRHIDSTNVLICDLLNTTIITPYNFEHFSASISTSHAPLHFNIIIFKKGEQNSTCRAKFTRPFFKSFFASNRWSNNSYRFFKIGYINRPYIICFNISYFFSQTTQWA